MRTRKRHVSIWLNENELAYLKRLSHDTGLKVDPLIRHLIMGVELHPRPPDEYTALLRELSAIGNNLNQLARVANATGSISVKAVETMLERHSEIWRRVKAL